MNNMLIDKMAVARNNIVHNKYLAVYIEADDIEAAKNTFSRLDSSIASGLKKLIGTDVVPCFIRERLSNLYDIYHVDSDVPFYLTEKELYMIYDSLRDGDYVFVISH